MKSNESTPEKKPEMNPTVETQKGIENHKLAATHFEAAAKSHLEAANHHKTGDHEKAAKSTMDAQNHSTAGHDAQKNVAKNHSNGAKNSH